MLNFGKSKTEDLEKIKRKDIETIWNGKLALEVANVVRYTPSACNSQPWRVVDKDNCFQLYRSTDITEMLSKGLIAFYNKIDMGIFMCFLEVTLKHFQYDLKRKIMIEDVNKNPIPVATYQTEKRI